MPKLSSVLVAIFLTIASANSFCLVEGYPRHISYSSSNGVNYEVKVILVPYYGSTDEKQAIISYRVNNAPGGDIEDRKDLKRIKQQFELAFQQYIWMRFTVDNKPNAPNCYAFQNDPSLVILARQ